MTIHTGVGIDIAGTNPKKNNNPANINKIFEFVINPAIPLPIAPKIIGFILFF